MEDMLLNSQPFIMEIHCSQSIAIYLTAIVSWNKLREQIKFSKVVPILACKAMVSVTKGKSKRVNGNSR